MVVPPAKTGSAVKAASLEEKTISFEYEKLGMPSRNFHAFWGRQWDIVQEAGEPLELERQPEASPHAGGL